jgi:hypothetical protein
MSKFKRRALGPLAATAVAVACGRPDFPTDLNTEGPPEVALVAVYSEGAHSEVAAYCSASETVKRNALYCPAEGELAPVEDALPFGFHVRVVFDELLDPSIEEIDEEAGTGSIVASDPVTLTCGGQPVAYDGFYDPSGNHLTFPGGPALVITATELIASGSACEVTLKDVIKDKEGESVPGDQRGPYDFKLTPFSVSATEPEEGATGVMPDASIVIAFNNHIDLESLEDNVTLEGPGGAEVQIAVALAQDTTDPENPVDIPTSITITPAANLPPGTYTLTIDTAADPEGGALGAPVTLSFTVGEAGPDGGPEPDPDAGAADGGMDEADAGATPDAGAADAEA